MKLPITAVIIAKNEENMLGNCIATINWCENILVINNGSSDLTTQIAQDHGATVVHFEHSSFARLRNEALKHIKTDWIFYIDADERVIPTLAKEILVQIEMDSIDAITMKRNNICYGKEFKYGGWENDFVTRIFRKSNLDGWYGEIHESPKFNGKEVVLNTPLAHLTHRNTTDNLNKTISWTKMEAELLAKGDKTPVKFTTLLRKGIMEFVRRAILKKGYKDGIQGLIEALVQGINRVLVYIQVWELQQKPDIAEKYHAIDREINKMWTKNEK